MDEINARLHKYHIQLNGCDRNRTFEHNVTNAADYKIEYDGVTIPIELCSSNIAYHYKIGIVSFRDNKRSHIIEQKGLVLLLEMFTNDKENQSKEPLFSVMNYTALKKFKYVKQNKHFGGKPTEDVAIPKGTKFYNIDEFCKKFEQYIDMKIELMKKNK